MTFRHLLSRASRFLIVGLVWLPCQSLADGILPVAEGRYSVVLTVDRKAALPAAGAWIEFVVTSDGAVPKRVDASGFVLGQRDEVIFVELSEQETVNLALARTQCEVRYRPVAAASPEAVADRERARGAGKPVTLAPRLRTVTVRVDASDEQVARWTPGDILVFPDLGTLMNRPSVTGHRTWSKDIAAMFVSAERSDAGRLTVDVVAEPRDALILMQASLGEELVTGTGTEGVTVTPPEPRCYIRHRRGGEVVSIEIPCQSSR